jgi:hypothetical protein
MDKREELLQRNKEYLLRKQNELQLSDSEMLDWVKGKRETKNVHDYFSDWEGYSCSVEDENGDTCLEVIEATRKELQRHLAEVHNIKVELKWN